MTRKKEIKFPFDDLITGKKANDGRKSAFARLKEKAKWVNEVTGEEQEVELALFGWDGTSPIIIVNWIEKTSNDTKERYTFAPHVNHVNVYTDQYTYIFKSDSGDTYTIYGQNFCSGANSIGGHHLVKNPEITKLTVKEIIKDQNDGSRARTRSWYSVDNSRKDYPIPYADKSAKILPKAHKLELVTGYFDFKKSILNGLDVQSSGYYVKYTDQSRYSHCNELPKDTSKLSKYYPIIKAKDLKDEIDKIPKKSVDLIALGLGSAGSGVIDQLMRTTMAKSYVVVDFDMVESKNLRNQMYSRRHVGDYKSRAMESMIVNIVSGLECISYNTKFQEVPFNRFKTKYIQLGFDSIKTRVEAFKKVADGTIEAEYIIDTRYDDLEASIYFVDVKDKAQMDYYYQQLMSDGEALEGEAIEQKPIPWKKWTQKEIKPISDRTSIGSCAPFHERLGVSCPCNTTDTCLLGSCYSRECMLAHQEVYNKNKITREAVETAWKAIYGAGRTAPTVESSCVKWNIIDIYKFASAYVISAIREIKDGKDKPFTHVEVTTNGMPKHIVMKK